MIGDSSKPVTGLEVVACVTTAFSWISLDWNLWSRVFRTLAPDDTPFTGVVTASEVTTSSAKRKKRKIVFTRHDRDMARTRSRLKKGRGFAGDPSIMIIYDCAI